MFEKTSSDVQTIFNGTSSELPPDTEFPLCCVIMAAGISQRFQELDTDNKLLVEFKGKPMLQWALDNFAQLNCHSRIVVARKDEIGSMVPQDSFQVIWNTGENLSPTVTIRKAILAVPQDSMGCLFAVGDQPFLTHSSIRRLCEVFQENPDKIVSLSWNQKRGNPVIFPRSLFPELLALEDGLSGRYVLNRHPELLILVEVHNPEELMDIDTRQQYTDACNGRHPRTHP